MLQCEIKTSRARSRDLSPIQPDGPPLPHLALTRRTLLTSGLMTVAGSAAAAAWPAAVEPHLLVVRTLPLGLPRWPREAPPLRVAFLSDLHVGCPSVGVDRLPGIVAEVNALRPDLVLLGGDYIEHVTGGSFVPPEATAERLADLKAPLGVWSVLGNHDWWYGGRKVRLALERAGIGVLENDAVRLRPEAPFWLAALADDSTRVPDVPGTLAQTAPGEPVLALAHDPGTFIDVPERVALTLCGHTHGGQVYLPGYGALRIPSRAPRQWAYGHRVVRGRHLLVTGGIGTSNLPIRFNMPPEIVLAEIAGAT